MAGARGAGLGCFYEPSGVWDADELCPLAHAPTNEMGVVFLFGVLARDLGYIVTLLQAEFPDCEALRRMTPEKWQRLRIEFEFESRNFMTHGHDVNGCDLIICWKHNWPECPVEVLELSKLAGKDTSD